MLLQRFRGVYGLDFIFCKSDKRRRDGEEREERYVRSVGRVIIKCLLDQVVEMYKDFYGYLVIFFLKKVRIVIWIVFS